MAKPPSDTGPESMLPRPVSEDELRQLALFAGFESKPLAKVVQHTAVIELPRGRALFRAGEPATHFYYLRYGQIKLTRNSFDGDEKVISVVRPGQTFAEAALFMGAPGYPVSSEAIDESVVLAFPGDLIKQLLSASPEACFRVMAVMSARLRELVLQIDELTLHNATHRLASYLLAQLPEGGARVRDIRLGTPKLVIASRLSIQPETLSRILAQLRERGLVNSEGANIVVHDVEGLRALTHAG